MIAYIEGRLLEKSAQSCVILTAGGVGYEVALPTHSIASLPVQGETVCFYVHTLVREDALELYGFETWDERQTFLVLLSVSKVGAKTALAMLSLYRPDEMRRIVMDDDLVALTRVSGVGKKSAQHILLELKYKMKADDMPVASALHLGKESGGSILRDAVQGLASLGYSEDEVLPVLKTILHDDPELTVNEVLRLALRALAK